MDDRITRLWGQQVMADNRLGVAGVLGTAFVAKSPPNGNTLLPCNMASSVVAINWIDTAAHYGNDKSDHALGWVLPEAGATLSNITPGDCLIYCAYDVDGIDH